MDDFPYFPGGVKSTFQNHQWWSVEVKDLVGSQLAYPVFDTKNECCF